MLLARTATLKRAGPLSTSIRTLITCRPALLLVGRFAKLSASVLTCFGLGKHDGIYALLWGLCPTRPRHHLLPWPVFRACRVLVTGSKTEILLAAGLLSTDLDAPTVCGAQTRRKNQELNLVESPRLIQIRH